MTRKITSNLVFLLYVSTRAFVIGQKQGQSNMVFKHMTADRKPKLKHFTDVAESQPLAKIKYPCENFTCEDLLPQANGS